MFFPLLLCYRLGVVAQKRTYSMRELHLLVVIPGQCGLPSFLLQPRDLSVLLLRSLSLLLEQKTDETYTLL